MNRENMQPAHWAEQNQDAMELVEIARSDIEQQHALYDTLVDGDGLKVDPYREVVAEELKAAQAASFGELVTAGAEVQYEDLAVMDSQIDERIAAAEQKLAEFYEYWQREAAAERELITEVLPGLEEKLGQVSLEAFIATKQQALDEDLAVAKQEGVARDELFAQAGQAWPIPRLIDVALALQQDADERRTVKDEFPVDKPERTSSEIIESVNRRYTREVLADASSYLALVLAEEPGHAFTLSEIGAFLYDNDVPNQPQRVSALISNYELGKTGIIGDTLQEHGLRFQRGRRTEYDEHGQKVGACRPVFRAVPLDGAYENQASVATDSGSRMDIWGVSEELDESRKHEEPAEPEAPEVGRDVWEEAFIWGDKGIREMIKRFEQDGTMLEEPMTQARFLRLASSRTFGTDTMLERGVQAKIITTTEAQGPIETWKYVCMALRQSHEGIFMNSKKRQKRAMELVRSEVASYFEAKQQVAPV